MKIVQGLQWTQDYIESVSYLLPNLKYLRKVSSKQGNKERWRHCHGIITYHDKKHYRITIYLSYHDLYSDKIKPYSTIDTLICLAHELAHLQHWTHSPEHKLLECQILTIFMIKLKESGYISEEEEFRSLR